MICFTAVPELVTRYITKRSETSHSSQSLCDPCCHVKLEMQWHLPLLRQWAHCTTSYQSCEVQQVIATYSCQRSPKPELFNQVGDRIRNYLRILIVITRTLSADIW